MIHGLAYLCVQYYFKVLKLLHNIIYIIYINLRYRDSAMSMTTGIIILSPDVLHVLWQREKLPILWQREGQSAGWQLEKFPVPWQLENVYVPWQREGQSAAWQPEGFPVPWQRGDVCLVTTGEISCPVTTGKTVSRVTTGGISCPVTTV